VTSSLYHGDGVLLYDRLYRLTYLHYVGMAFQRDGESKH